jgi:hypothetical protein
MKQNVTVDAQVIRGPQSWAYIYIVLAFALSIEGNILQMITPLAFPFNLIVYAAAGIATVWLFLFNGWLHNKLIGLQMRYESEPH